MPKTRSKRRRRALIALAVIGPPTIILATYAAIFCMRNAQRRADWAAWTARPPGPALPWAQLSNSLQRFWSENLTFKSKSGLVGPLAGYRDDEGRVVIEPRFSACGERFYDGLAWAADPQQRRSGYINPDGSWAIIVSGHTHSDFVGGMGKFQVIGNDGYPMEGFVNREGVEVVPPKYRLAHQYVDGYVLVEERTWIGMIADRIGGETGEFPRTCWETRVLILDKIGKESTLPRSASQRSSEAPP